MHEGDRHAAFANRRRKSDRVMPGEASFLAALAQRR
jgi:hypothetical protein